jgi:hypothetical protein
MKKAILLGLVLILAVIAGYKLFLNKETKTPEKKDESLVVGKNSSAFDVSFSKIMNDYYSIKDALVDWDTTKANQAAVLLQQDADSLKINELKADSNVIQTAQNFASSISSESKGFIGETAIEQKRRAFNMLTDEIYNLVRTVKYEGQTIYHIKCPMAFNDSEEAYWLSNTSKVINPYLGSKHPKYNNKMLGCGEVVDSLNFVKK